MESKQFVEKENTMSLQIDNLKARLEPLLDGYFAPDILQALAELCESELQKSINQQMGIRAGLYERWAIAFRTAFGIADFDKFTWGQIQRLKRYLTKLEKEV